MMSTIFPSQTLLTTTHVQRKHQHWPLVPHMLTYVISTYIMIHHDTSCIYSKILVTRLIIHWSHHNMHHRRLPLDISWRRSLRSERKRALLKKSIILGPRAKPDISQKIIRHTFAGNGWTSKLLRLSTKQQRPSTAVPAPIRAPMKAETATVSVAELQYILFVEPDFPEIIGIPCLNYTFWNHLIFHHYSLTKRSVFHGYQTSRLFGRPSINMYQLMAPTAWDSHAWSRLIWFKHGFFPNPNPF